MALHSDANVLGWWITRLERELSVLDVSTEAALRGGDCTAHQLNGVLSVGVQSAVGDELCFLSLVVVLALPFDWLDGWVYTLKVTL